MNPPTPSPEVWDVVKVILSIATPILGGFAGYLLKEVRRLGSELDGATEKLERDIKEAEKSAKSSADRAKTDTDSVVRSVGDLRVEIARDYVSHERFEREMQRIVSQIGEMRTDVRAALSRLEEKLDRRP